MWEYSQNVKISKTPNEAVSIEVLDSDPQVACDMVNAMIELYNIKDDPEELNNLYEVEKEIGQELLNEIKVKLKEINAPYISTS